MFTGDPALLHHNICNQNIDMGKIEKLDIESLRNLGQSCGISTSSKSKASQQFNTRLQDILTAINWIMYVYIFVIVG